MVDSIAAAIAVGSWSAGVGICAGAEWLEGEVVEVGSGRSVVRVEVGPGRGC